MTRALDRRTHEAWIVERPAHAGRALRRRARRVRPDDLAAPAIRAAVERTTGDGVEDVFLGAPTRRVRTIATSREWQRSSRASQSRSAARRSIGCVDRGSGDQLGRARDRGRRRRRVHRRRRRIDDSGAVRHGQGRIGLGSRPARARTRRSAGASSTRSSPRITAVLDGRDGRERRRAVRRVARAAGRVRARKPPPGHRGHRGRPLRRSDRPDRSAAAQGRPGGRGARRASPRRHHPGGARQARPALPRTAVRSRPATLPASTTARRPSCSSRPSSRANTTCTRWPASCRRRWPASIRRSWASARSGVTQGAGTGRDRRRRPRPHRAQRGVRLAVAGLHRELGLDPRRSTSTAGRSRSAIRSG